MRRPPIALLALLALLCFTGCATPAQSASVGGVGVDAAGFVAAGSDADGDDAVADAAVDDASDVADSSRAASDAAATVDADAGPPDSVTTDSDASDNDLPDATTAAQPPTVAAYDDAIAKADASLLAAWLAAYDMPVCAQSTCVFAIEAPSATSVVVLGDWNGWSGGDALTKSSLAPGWWLGKATLTVDVVHEYKPQIDGAWTLDPSNRHIRFAAFGPNSAIYPKTGSRLQRIAGVASAALSEARDLYVYLPAAYVADPTLHLPVVYWQDGWNVFQNPKTAFGSWDIDLTADALMASGEVAAAIFVGVDTADRLREYTWVPLELDGKVYEPKITAYADLLVDVVVPLVDTTYRTLADRSHRLIAGSSLGGISALYIAWQRWQTFGGLASFSGAFWVGEPLPTTGGGTAKGPPMRALIAANAAGVPKGALRAYIDSGDSAQSGAVCYACDSWVYSDWTRNALIAAGWDSRPEWDTDSDVKTPPTNLPATTAVAAVPALAWTGTPTAVAGWKSTLATDHNLLSLVGHGHKHNEAAWKARAGAALRFLLPGPALK